ncbi:hypothetical protein C8J57DRAFT_1680376 [Mycena rebaudengoi]|nr:hypothetical protein C8J57DRAFT_1680376 [Mycena rebaudengoi]
MREATFTRVEKKQCEPPTSALKAHESGARQILVSQVRCTNGGAVDSLHRVGVMPKGCTQGMHEAATIELGPRCEEVPSYKGQVAIARESGAKGSPGKVHSAPKNRELCPQLQGRHNGWPREGAVPGMARNVLVSPKPRRRRWIYAQEECMKKKRKQRGQRLGIPLRMATDRSAGCRVQDANKIREKMFVPKKEGGGKDTKHVLCLRVGIQCHVRLSGVLARVGAGTARREGCVCTVASLQIFGGKGDGRDIAKRMSTRQRETREIWRKVTSAKSMSRRQKPADASE